MVCFAIRIAFTRLSLSEWWLVVVESQDSTRTLAAPMFSWRDNDLQPPSANLSHHCDAAFAISVGVAVWQHCGPESAASSLIGRS
jgi:hypothetical protein